MDSHKKCRSTLARYAPNHVVPLPTRRSSYLSLARRCLLVCLAAVSGSASAAGAYTGTVASVLAFGNNTNAYFVYINGIGGQSPPSCVTQNNRFVISPATDAGKAQIASVLSALARGATVSIQGTGTCDIWPDTESILLLQST
jgi:hypothetical protein